MSQKTGLYKNCITCNKEFYVIKSEATARKYCCHQCSVKSGKDHHRFGGGLMEICCLNCNKTFYTKKSRVEKGAKFCCLNCMGQYKSSNPHLYKRTKNNCVCKNCNKEFHLKACAIKRGGGSYCSKLCRYESQKVTMIGIRNPNYRHGRTYEPGFYKETSKKWIINNKHKISLYARKQKSIRRSLEGKFSIKEIMDMKIKQRQKCAFCFKSIKKKYHIDHIMPVKLGGQNYIWNIQLLCPTCNMRKGAKHPNDWAAENGRLF